MACGDFNKNIPKRREGGSAVSEENNQRVAQKIAAIIYGLVSSQCCWLVPQCQASQNNTGASNKKLDRIVPDIERAPLLCVVYVTPLRVSKAP